jgi:hypothetical protein
MTTTDGVHDGFASEMEFCLYTSRGQRNLPEDIFMRGAKSAIWPPEWEEYYDGNYLYDEITTTSADPHDNFACHTEE